jgi:hypothetical protein
MLVIPMAQLLTQLDNTLTGLGGLYLFLFGNAATPAIASVIGDFTVADPTWSDVAPLTGRTSAAAAGPFAFSQWDTVNFTNTSGGPVDVYGYVVCDSGKSVLYWAELNASAPVIVPAGSSYVVRPYYSRTNQT